MLRRFAIPRLPMCNSALFLQASCVKLFLHQHLYFWRVYLRSLQLLTAVRFGLQSSKPLFFRITPPDLYLRLLVFHQQR